MDTTIRNLDRDAYRRLKARAALAGMTIGEVVNEAIRTYLSHPGPEAREFGWEDLRPFEFPPGTEHLSEEIDRIVYGA